MGLWLEILPSRVSVVRDTTYTRSRFLWTLCALQVHELVECWLGWLASLWRNHRSSTSREVPKLNSHLVKNNRFLSNYNPAWGSSFSLYEFGLHQKCSNKKISNLIDKYIALCKSFIGKLNKIWKDSTYISIFFNLKFAAIILTNF